jgi:hypothetical protein
MTLDQRDWRLHIVRLVQIKQELFEADDEKLWTFHLPSIAASERQITEAEQALGFCLELEYRSFLKCANGWRAFYQTVDLFGTEDLCGGERMVAANAALDQLSPRMLEQSGVSRGELIPIAATTMDLDIFAMRLVSGVLCSPVIWFAGSEIDRFSSFEEFFASMTEYNRRELLAMRNQ